MPPPRKKKVPPVTEEPEPSPQTAAVNVEPISPRSKRAKVIHQHAPLTLECITLEEAEKIVEDIITSPEITISGISTLTKFFNHIEIEAIRKSIQPLVKFDSWITLSDKTREKIFRENPEIEKKILKQTENLDPSIHNTRWYQATYVSTVVDTLLSPEVSEDLKQVIIEFFIILLAQIPTRRVVKSIFMDKQVLPILRMDQSPYIDLLSWYMHFPVNEFSAEPISASQTDALIETEIYDPIRALLYPKYKDLSLSLFGTTDEEKISKLVDQVSEDDLWVILEEVMCVSRTSRVTAESILNEGIIEAKKISRNIFSKKSVFPTEVDFNAAQTTKITINTPQYLTLSDYLDRNLRLYREEVFGKIRNAFDDAIPRLGHTVNKSILNIPGSSRMIAKIAKSEIITVNRNIFSGTVPVSVRGEITVDLSGVLPPIRDEWDSMRSGDVLFLVKLSTPSNDPVDWSLSMGIHHVRGCTVEELLDQEGNLITGGPDSGGRVGSKRIFRVLFDPIQWYSDSLNPESALLTFDIALRLKSTETVFKSVLASSQQSPAPLPEWLNDFFLGFGSPNIDIGGSFESSDEELVHAISTQDEGQLTLITAPVFTDRKFVISKIIHTLVEKDTSEKILVISKTNEVLNDLLYSIDVAPELILKIGGLQEDAYSRSGRINYLLNRRLELLAEVKRLGLAIGLAEEIADDFAFNCDTANEFFHTKIKPMFDAYIRICKSTTKTGGDDEEEILIKKLTSNPPIAVELLSGYNDPETDEGIPFKELVVVRAKRLLQHNKFSYIMDPFKRFSASGSGNFLREIQDRVFGQLTALSALEILRTVRDRSEYLLTCHSRVIAGTSTSVMMNRQNFKKSRVKFSTIIIDNANQMMDLESFLCFTAGNNSEEVKRIVLIGDDNQLGPIVDTRGLEKSLFSRLKQLGQSCHVIKTPVINVSPFLGSLVGGDLEPGRIPSASAPPGVAYDCQFVNVPNTEEMEPSPNMFQNLGEAEYLVALFMYLRLKNVPSSSISILTAYSGQKALIQDVIKAKCDWNPLFGIPKHVTTIDQFQGQANDVVLVSLVRTQNSGHMRDVRRWITAIGCARRGLYIFGNLHNFSHDMDPRIEVIFGKLRQRPTELVLVTDVGGQTSVANTDQMMSLLQNELQKELRKTRI